MQQSTVKQLYAYWDRMRNGRVAPRRFEIEPVQIASLLSETFIAEYAGPGRYRFRLAGTQICTQFCRELRGTDLSTLWHEQHRDEMAEFLGRVFGEGAVGHALFRAHNTIGRHCQFEFILMPLTHAGDAINRGLGAIVAIDPPFWLGTEPLQPLEILSTSVLWPDGAPAFPSHQHRPQPSQASLAIPPRQFTVYNGGLTEIDRQ